MFITAVCLLFLLKLKWPKNKSVYDKQLHQESGLCCFSFICRSVPPKFIEFCMETLCLWPLEGYKHDFRKVKRKSLTYLASDSYTNTVISDCLFVKMASKSVITPITIKTVQSSVRLNIFDKTIYNPVEALIFFRLLLSSCLNWKIYCDDHTSLSLTIYSHLPSLRTEGG